MAVIGMYQVIGFLARPAKTYAHAHRNGWHFVQQSLQIVLLNKLEPARKHV